MCVVDIRIAAVITHADIACIACHKDAALITGEGSQLARAIDVPDRVIQREIHCIAIAVTGPGGLIQIGVYRVAGKVITGPGCTIPHVKVHDACTAAAGITYIALPEGVLRIETDADIGTGTAIIHAAAEIDIAFHLYMIIACTDDRAFGILLDIHIHLSAILGNIFTVSTDRICCSVDRLDDAAANLNPGGHCADAFVRTGSIALISHNIHETINSDRGHNAVYTVHALDHCSIPRLCALRTQSQYIVSPCIVNMNRTTGINEQCTGLTSLGAFRTDRYGTGMIDVHHTLADRCDTGGMSIGCCIYRQLVTIHIHGHIVIFIGAGNTCTDLRKPCTPSYQMLFRCDGRAVCGKYIGTIVLQDAILLIEVVFLRVAGDGLRIGVFHLFFRIGDARCHRAVFVAAFAVLLAECDASGLQRLAACSQTTSDLHIAGEVLLAFSKVAVGQLACQCIQYVGYTVFVIHHDAGVVGDQGYDRAFCRLLDDGVASFVVLRCFAVAFMRVVNIRISAVVIDGQCFAVFLENVACVCCITAASQLRYTAAGKAARNHFAILLVSPGSTICQPQVKDAIIG